MIIEEYNFPSDYEPFRQVKNLTELKSKIKMQAIVESITFKESFMFLSQNRGSRLYCKCRKCNSKLIYKKNLHEESYNLVTISS